jgi:phenol 2-monooxygenase
MIIPREDNKIRLYLQLDPTSGLVDELGRIDKSAVNPALLMQVAQKTMHPYRMDAVGEPEWWSIYMSAY